MLILVPITIGLIVLIDLMLRKTSKSKHDEELREKAAKVPKQSIADE